MLIVANQANSHMVGPDTALMKLHAVGARCCRDAVHDMGGSGGLMLLCSPEQKASAGTLAIRGLQPADVTQPEAFACEEPILH